MRAFVMSRAWLIGGVLAVFGIAGCTGCPGGDPPGTDSGPTGDAQLAFASPLNGQTVDEDLDAAAEGLQTDVSVHVDRPEGDDADVDVTLFVDDAEVATVSAGGARANFRNVTLAASADGVEHVLRVEADGYKSDSVTITAVLQDEVREPSCAFVTPGATVDPPFDVVVTCTDADANEPATLRVLDASGVRVGPSYTGELDGNLRFSATGIDLEDGDYTLAFALDNYAETAIEQDITVEDVVVVPNPVCTITDPAPGSSVAATFDVTVECANVPAGVTSVTVTLTGATASPVSYFGALSASNNGMAATVQVTAVGAGANDVTAAVTNYPSSADTITVDVAALPVCDAEIRSPVDGAVLTGDVDTVADDYQIDVLVGAVGDPVHCTNANVEVLVDGVVAGTRTLPGTAAQSDVVDVRVTVPVGTSTITATIIKAGNPGTSDEIGVTFTPATVGMQLDGLTSCGGFGDYCFNLSHANQGSGADYQRTLVVTAPLPQSGQCSGLTGPVLSLDGGADIAADGPWALVNSRCEATFSLVSLHPNELPDDVMVDLAIEAAIVGGASETLAVQLGLDRVAPTLTWVTVDGEVFGADDDQNPATAPVDVAISATVTGMGGRSVALVDSLDVSTTLATCGPLGAATDAACSFARTFADGSYALDAVGTDAAGNALVNDLLSIVVDSNAPCVASIALGADTAAPVGTLNQTEGATTDVTVTFDAGACAIEDGQQVQLSSTLDGALGAASASGNAVTFTGVTLSEGTHTLSVVASDVAGNAVLPDGNALDVVVDLTPPTCAISAPTDALLGTANDEDTATAGLQVTFTVGTDGASARLLLDGSDAGGGDAVTGSVDVADVTVPDGTPTFTAECTDAAGNVATSAAYEPVVDLEAPVVSWDFTTPTVRLTRNADDGGADLGPLDNSNTAGYQQVLSATLTGCDGEPVVVTANGVQVNDGAPPSANGASVGVAVSIPDGDAQPLTVSCADEAGNVGSATVTATVDTVAPAAPADFTAVLNSATDATRLGWVDIDFTMPGDDGASGTVTSVALLATHAPVALADFDAPAEPYVQIPMTPTTTLPLTTGADGVPALWFGPHTWNIALRAVDDVGNVADTDLGTGAVELPAASVGFDLTHRDIQHVDVEGGEFDRFGEVVSSTSGDLNGDGIGDLVVSAWNTGSDCIDLGDPFGYCNGALYVLYGQSNAAALETTPMQRILGIDAENLGFNLAIVPSINGDDSIDDLLVQGYTASGNPAVYVYYGVAGGGALPARPDFVIEHTTSVSFAFGKRVAGVGDVNGDGYGDFIAGDHYASPPTIYLFGGSATKRTGTVTLSTEALTQFILPAGTGANQPASAVALGNLNADIHGTSGNPLNDFAIGFGHDSSHDGGRIYVLHGREVWPASVTLASITAPDQILSPATTFGTRYGIDVAAADVNGDGDVDLAAKGRNSMLVLVNDGSGSFPVGGSYRLMTNRAHEFSQTGGALGDVNGDGFADVAVGSSDGVWVYLGSAATSNRSVPHIRYQTGTDQAFRVIRAGDLDADGHADIAFTGPSTQSLYLRFGP